jgi:hypothetical protein
MVTPRNYAKLCDAGRLTQELITAGILQSPTGGFKMYGVSVDPTGPTTTVYVIDTLLPADGTTIDNTVAAHVNTPLNSPAVFLNNVNNAKLAWISGTQIGIGSAGVQSRISDSTGIYDMTWATQLVANIAASGAGGLDTGAPANNTWYAVFVIGDTRNVNTPAALFSISPTAPTMPAGYNVFRRVGWARRTGSSVFLKFDQIGNGSVRTYYYDEQSNTLNALSAGNSTVFAAVSLAAFVPPTVRQVGLRVNFTNIGGGNTDAARFRETGSTQALPVTIISPGVVQAAGSTGLIVMLDMVCNANQSIDYLVTLAVDTLTIGVRSFVDEV